MSHGNVAKNRYKSIDDSGHFQSFCEGSTTGHQKRSPLTRKDACSIPCHISDRNPSANTEGICHTTSVTLAAIQPTAGCNRAIGFTSFCNGRCGSSFKGAPIKINGGASVISKRC